MESESFDLDFWLRDDWRIKLNLLERKVCEVNMLTHERSQDLRENICNNKRATCRFSF